MRDNKDLVAGVGFALRGITAVCAKARHGIGMGCELQFLDRRTHQDVLCLTVNLVRLTLLV